MAASNVGRAWAVSEESVRQFTVMGYSLGLDKVTIHLAEAPSVSPAIVGCRSAG